MKNDKNQEDQLEIQSKFIEFPSRSEQPRLLPGTQCAAFLRTSKRSFGVRPSTSRSLTFISHSSTSGKDFSAARSYRGEVEGGVKSRNPLETPPKTTENDRKAGESSVDRAGDPPLEAAPRPPIARSTCEASESLTLMKLSPWPRNGRRRGTAPYPQRFLDFLPRSQIE